MVLLFFTRGKKYVLAQNKYILEVEVKKRILAVMACAYWHYQVAQRQM